jgi:hypothetical protein
MGLFVRLRNGLRSDSFRAPRWLGYEVPSDACRLAQVAECAASTCGLRSGENVLALVNAVAHDVRRSYQEFGWLSCVTAAPLLLPVLVEREWIPRDIGVMCGQLFRLDAEVSRP